jgi:hypothetical protein
MLVGVVAVVSFIGACEKQAAVPQATSASLPTGLIVSTEPPGAVNVAAFKAAAKDGTAVVVKGKVAGQKEPMSPNRAILTLADSSLPTCDATPDDKCETPWDACCEPASEIAAKTISIQVADSDGRPLPVGLGGSTGIAPLKTIIVAGIAKTVAGSNAVVIHANQIYVVP